MKTYPVFHGGKLVEATEEQIEGIRRNRMTPEQRNTEDIADLKFMVLALKEQVQSLLSFVKGEES